MKLEAVPWEKKKTDKIIKNTYLACLGGINVQIIHLGSVGIPLVEKTYKRAVKIP